MHLLVLQHARIEHREYFRSFLKRMVTVGKLFILMRVKTFLR